MTTVDVYDAWLTAGETLRPYGDWLVANWPWLTVLAATLLAVWAVAWFCRDDYRSHNDRRAAWLTACNGPRPEPAACLQIMRATDKAAKGDPQP